MPALTFVAAILPDKEEEWRRFVQEVTEERVHEYEGLRLRLGIHNESVWLARPKGGETAVVYLEAADPGRIVPTLVASEEPFDLWFKEQLSELHGPDLARDPRKTAAGLLFAHQDGSGHQPLAAGEVPS